VLHFRVPYRLGPTGGSFPEMTFKKPGLKPRPRHGLLALAPTVARADTLDITVSSAQGVLQVLIQLHGIALDNLVNLETIAGQRCGGGGRGGV
jgi:hypothetical protein